jgi:uncharacterized RDD family membrane protein YckC
MRAAVAAKSQTIDVATGGGVALRVAGAGGRSYAFVIDWHIRVLAALTWVLAGMLLRPGSPSTFEFAVLLPAGVIYFLYHPVLEVAMHGRTPGKRIARVRIVSRDGATPGVHALLIRNVMRIVDSLPACYGVGLGAVLVTEQHVRIGDLAAGTLLVYDDEPPPAAARRGRVAATDEQAVELIAELLARWHELSSPVRQRLGRQLLARVDPTVAAPVDEGAVRGRLAKLLEPQPSK